MNKEIIAIFSSAIFLTYILLPLNAYAASYDSLVNGDWDTPTTWNPTGTPSTGDDVSIENSNQIGVSSSVAAADVNFASNGALSISIGSGFTGDITATGAGSAGTGTLTLNGGNLVTGTIGTNTDYLGTINAGISGVSEITGAVFAARLNIGPGIASVQLDTTSTITTTNFESNFALILLPGVGLTGNITATGAGSAGTGILELATNNYVNGTIGTSTDYLGRIIAEGPAPSEITGAVNAALLTIGIGNSSGGSLQLDTTSHITTTMFNEADTLILNNANLTGNIDFNNNAGTVTVSNGNSIVGTVENSTGTSAEGALTFEGSTITGGNMGAAGTKELLAVNFDGTGASSILGNDIYAAATTINNSATVTANGNRNITGALTLTGTSALNIGATTLTVNGAYTQGTNTALDLAISSSSSYGKIISTVAASVASGSIVNVSVEGYIPNGTIFTIINTGGAGVGNSPSTITSDGSLTGFSSSILHGNLVLTSENKLVSLANNPNAGALATVLVNMANPSSDMQTVLGTLAHLSSAQITSALNSMGPIADGGVKENSFAMLNNFVGVSLDRIQEVLTRDNMINAELNKAENALSHTGVSSGDQPGLNGIWAKPYASYLTQGRLQEIQGYDAWNTGTVVGLDRLINDNFTLGVSGAYAYGQVDGEVNNASTDITSAQGTIYAGYQGPDSNYFIDAAGSFAWNWYNGRRDISFINRTADSDYEGQQYGAYLASGYKFNLSDNPEFAQLLGENFEFTPLFSLQWTHLSLGSYTESNAGSMDLNVNKQDYNLLESGLGASFSSPEKYDWGIFTPEIHVKWLYDYIDDGMVVTSSFTGGGGSFTSNGATPAKDGLDFGGKLSFDLKKDISLIASGDIETKNKFLGLYGSGSIRYKF